MSLLSIDTYNRHQSTMYVTLREEMQPGDALFIGVSEQSLPDGSVRQKYIMRRQFFIDSHLGYGIEEKVSVGVVDSNKTKTLSALGIWEVGKSRIDGRVEIRPTWNFTEAQLKQLLARVGMADEAKAVYMSYRDLKDAIAEASRLAA